MWKDSKILAGDFRNFFNVREKSIPVSITFRAPTPREAAGLEMAFSSEICDRIFRIFLYNTFFQPNSSGHLAIYVATTYPTVPVLVDSLLPRNS